MLGIEKSTLTVQFVAPVDEDLHFLPKCSCYGVVLRRDDMSVFVPVGNSRKFSKFFKELDLDPIMLLVSAVFGSMNDEALELLEQVIEDQETLQLNGDAVTWRDLISAQGRLGSEDAGDLGDDELAI